jgi:2-amino-4-hydroxy-6-hydroxymethyldihydropteridine diphosphokinase
MPNHIHHTYLALGGNLGDRTANLQAAINRLQAGGHLWIKALSPLYETAPVGYADQPDFLNMALEAETDLAPLDLLAYLKEIEATLGRQPNFRNGPRPIDLDLIFYDNLTLDVPALQIPHPRLRGRGFVLKPLNDLAPNYLHPRYRLSVAQLLAEVDLAGAGVRPFHPAQPLLMPGSPLPGGFPVKKPP